MLVYCLKGEKKKDKQHTKQAEWEGEDSKDRKRQNEREIGSRMSGVDKMMVSGLDAHTQET